MNSEIFKSLVADYNSSEDDEPPCSKSRDEDAPPLASALEMLDQNEVASSVFTNPYRNAETYERSVLEKHVKMTTTLKETATKRICFKFRKGKCRLGDKCHFLHQNVLQGFSVDAVLSDSEETDSSTNTKKSKRCGLKDDLVPPKKYLKTFNKCK